MDGCINKDTPLYPQNLTLSNVNTTFHHNLISRFSDLCRNVSVMYR